MLKRSRLEREALLKERADLQARLSVKVGAAPHLKPQEIMRCIECGSCLVNRDFFNVYRCVRCNSFFHLDRKTFKRIFPKVYDKYKNENAANITLFKKEL